MYVLLVKLAIMFGLLGMFNQNTYGQENNNRLSGKWKCSKEMFKEWGFRYAVMRGKVSFKEDNTFKVKVKGRSHMGHKFWRKRTITIKIKGLYSMKNDSLVLIADSANVKCYVDPDIDNPVNTPRYEMYERIGTWNPLERRYSKELTQCRFHEEAVRKKMIEIWNKGYMMELPDKNLLKLGKGIILEK